MKKCKNCGYCAENDDMLYCPICGSEFDFDFTGIGSQAESNPNISRLSQKFQEQLVSQRKSHTRKLVLSILCVLALLGLTAIFLQALSSGEISFPASSSASLADQAAVTPAQASDSQVVFRNAAKDGVITADGEVISFTYVGQDAVVAREELKDVCIVRIVAPDEEGGYQTAAVWYNYRYGNDVTFGDPNNYGAYTSCDVTGLGEPSDKVVDVLTWAYYDSLLNSINEQDASLLRYSTNDNLSEQRVFIYDVSNAESIYDTSDFTAVCDPTSIQYNNKTIIYNASFISYPKNRATGETTTVSNHRTMQLVWEDGMWKVNSTALLSEEDFAAGNYATD